MFSWCDNLSKLDVSNFDTSKVTDMSDMFSSCNKLTDLDISGFKMDNCSEDKATNMIAWCENLKSIKVAPNFKVSFDLGKNDNFVWKDGNGKVCTSTVKNLPVSMLYTRYEKTSNEELVSGKKYGGYTFVKGKDGKEPSNYRSYFGGNCWEPVPGTDKYYFHMFAKEQPDLNWENPKLRQKLYDMINWWLEKGLSGFRIDAIINIKKDLEFPDFEPDGADGMAGCWKMVESVDGVGELLEDLKKNTFQKYDAFTVGEVFNMKEDELPEFIGENGHFSTIFDFSAHCLSDGEHGWYDAPKMEFSKWRKAIFQSQMETQKYGFKANIIENHDEPRGVSRFLPAYAQTPEGTKMLGTVNLLLRGIPFIYQGQEIGMKNAKWNSIDEYDDISTKDQYQIARKAGLSDQEALEVCNRMSRDNARTPMQWTSEENAGFTKGTAWLKINPDYKEINVENQENDPDSVLNYYRKLVALRKSDEFKNVFTYGEFIPEYEEMDHIQAFYRKDAATCILVAANFGTDAAGIELKGDVKKVLLSNQKDETADYKENRLNLKSCEVVVLEMEME